MEASIMTTSYTRREIEEDAEVITSNDSEIIRGTLRVYGSIYLACMLLYVLLRKRYPKLFNIRSWARNNQSRLACLQEYGWFSWFWRVFRVTDLELQDECGLDAVCFLRALRFGRQLTYLGCFNAIWLIPLYRTAPESSDTAYLEDRFVLISISNLPTSSNRFLATVIAAYLTYFYAMYLIFHETKWFTSQRHRFLAKKKPRNYAVYVSGIPEAYRSSHQLENYFRQCSSQHAVLEAHICRDTPKLDSKVARRLKVVQQLEHAVAEEKRTGKTAQHVAINWRHYVGGRSSIRQKKSPRHNREHHGSVLQRVESVRELEAELDYLNRTIARKSQEITQASSRRGMLCRMNASTDLMHAIQEDVLSDDPDESHDNKNDQKNDSSSIVMSPLSEEHDDDDEEAFSRHHRSGSNLSPSVGLRNETMEEEEEKKEDVLLGELLGGPPVSASAELMDHFDPAFGAVVPVLEELPNNDAELLDHLDPALETVPVLDEELRNNDNELPSSGFLETIDNVNNPEWSKQQSTDEEQGLTNEFLQKLEAATAGSSPLKRTGSGKRDRSEYGGDKDSSDRSERSFSSRGSSSALLVTKTIRRSVVSGSRTIGKAGTSIVEGSRATASTIAKNSRAAGAQASKSIAKGSRVAGVQAERLIHNASDKGKESLKKAQQVGTNLVTSAGAVVPMLLLNKSEGQAREAGFVVFTNLYMVQTALQMIHHPKPYVMDVTPAGDPCDIFWRNVGLPQRARRTGMLAAITASTILCFFWSIPMAFVSSLTEVNSLKESLPTVGRWIEEYPWLETVFAQIAPMLLLFFNEAILPVVLKYFATWEGHISSAMLEASLFTKLGFFMVSLVVGVDFAIGCLLLLQSYISLEAPLTLYLSFFTFPRSYKHSLCLHFLDLSLLS